MSGDDYLAIAVTFYSPDHPDSAPLYRWSDSPWITAARRAREGWAAVCRADALSCIDAAVQAAPDKSRVMRATYTAVAPFLGVAGEPMTFVFVMVPSQP